MSGSGRQPLLDVRTARVETLAAYRMEATHHRCAGLLCFCKDSPGCKRSHIYTRQEVKLTHCYRCGLAR